MILIMVSVTGLATGFPHAPYVSLKFEKIVCDFVLVIVIGVVVFHYLKKNI